MDPYLIWIKKIHICAVHLITAGSLTVPQISCSTRSLLQSSISHLHVEHFRQKTNRSKPTPPHHRPHFPTQTLTEKKHVGLQKLDQSLFSCQPETSVCQYVSQKALVSQITMKQKTEDESGKKDNLATHFVLTTSQQK